MLRMTVTAATANTVIVSAATAARRVIVAATLTANAAWKHAAVTTARRTHIRAGRGHKRVRGGSHSDNDLLDEVINFPLFSLVSLAQFNAVLRYAEESYILWFFSRA